MPFVDLDEHLAEVFGGSLITNWDQASDLAQARYEWGLQQNRESKAWSRWAKGAGLPRPRLDPEAARERIRKSKQVKAEAKARAQIPPGRWTKVHGKWIKA